MKARILAWAIVAGVIYLGFVGVRSWKNPWSLPTAVSPVIGMLPPMTKCDEDCK